MGIAPGTGAVSRARDSLLRRLVPVISRPIVKAIAGAESDTGRPVSGRTMDELVFSSQLVIASGSAELDYRRTDRPEHVRFVGELRGITTAPAAPAARPRWWDELDGRRVILVTQGTQNIDPSDLLRPATVALAGADALVVATTGVAGRDRLPFTVPGNTRVIGSAPFDELLPLVDIAVTNGGWGGTLAMLAHGIPLVIAGGDLDKPEVAARVAWAGAGVNLRTGRPRPQDIAAAVERLEDDPSYRERADSVGRGLRDLGGAVRAAELLESLAARSAP
jgi:UDP:flavonoid glycosyltransferase YjiC (YdhE family)